IRRVARENNILFIADEIATGFGRTGSMFACHEAAIEPDILCVGKALSGGHMPLAATLASEEVFAAFLGTEDEKALMHGPTFMAHPIACAAANASL
ncbi:aminotransferase class III-fold pyridoxal phosphate-dependent enzyme, partial [Lactococcus lactis]|uniref:aminotransferase class III-fold pyridoxal phosphate-dependent enzyme n=1 Tax=Lactococcus lactis TaxID=1358 RepID=UPI003D0D84A1